MKKTLLKILILLFSICMSCTIFFACAEDSDAETPQIEQPSISFKTFIVNGNTVSGKVRNSVTVFDFNNEITVTGDAIYAVSFDELGMNNSITGKVPLEEGNNVFYVFRMENNVVKEEFVVHIYRNKMFTVSFEGLSEPQMVEEGFCATMPTAEPNRTGYSFEGWNFDFDTIVMDNINIGCNWNSTSMYALNSDGIITGLTELGENLTQLNIPESIDGITVIGIEEYAFRNNVKITSVTLPDTLKVIYEYAFSGCTSLESITIPEGVRAIYGYAFNGCNALRYMKFEGTEGTMTECTNPACGVTICPASRELGFTTHYHSSSWLTSEIAGSAFGHYHWIFSHDLSNPEEAWKYFVEDAEGKLQAGAMHNHALGGQGSHWSYSEEKDEYYFYDEKYYSYGGTSVNVDFDIRGWVWLDASELYWFNGTKGEW